MQSRQRTPSCRPATAFQPDSARRRAMQASDKPTRSRHIHRFLQEGNRALSVPPYTPAAAAGCRTPRPECRECQNTGRQPEK